MKVTFEEFEALANDRCPDCGAKDQLAPGPRGGASINIRCANCGKGFNVTRYAGKLLWAQRIPDPSTEFTKH